MLAPAQFVSREMASYSTHLAFGKLLQRLARAATSSEGEDTNPLRNRSPAPSPSDNFWTAASRTRASRILCRLARTFAERSGSYSPRTEACWIAVAAPRLCGWSGLPSILVGRPSWVSTSKSGHVAADATSPWRNGRAAGEIVIGFGAGGVGKNVLDRTAARRQARQSERRRHQLQNCAARVAVQHFRWRSPEIRDGPTRGIPSYRPAGSGCANTSCPVRRWGSGC